jgi:hypothetical protein
MVMIMIMITMMMMMMIMIPRGLAGAALPSRRDMEQVTDVTNLLREWEGKEEVLLGQVQAKYAGQAPPWPLFRDGVKPIFARPSSCWRTCVHGAPC